MQFAPRLPLLAGLLSSYGCAVLLMSCGAAASTNPGGPPAQVGGRWLANMTVTAGTEFPNGTTFSAFITVTQSGSALNGSFGIQGGYQGTVTGTVVANGVSFTLMPDPPCGGSFSGHGTVAANDSTMAGSYSGSDCGGSVSATISTSRS